MKKQSIEFEAIPEDTEATAVVRGFFRVPVMEGEPVNILINQKKFPVSDMSQGGIGVCLENGDSFSPGQIIEDCELTMADIRLAGLKAQVVHCSSSAQGLLQCGIKWLDMGEAAKDQLNHILAKMKARALQDDDRDGMEKEES